MADYTKFFENTYITGSGRSNYLRIDHLEDPLFTSFTFDVDYISSPLFYTINYDTYGYPDVDRIPNNIENALKIMYKDKMGIDDGYDILPVLSASILDGNKLGFGLQQNVYMDTPLYGATEYIYMVDKRNGGADQNDARYDNNKFSMGQGGDMNSTNSYKLGDSVKEIVNESDRVWAQKQKENHDKIIEETNKITSDKSKQTEYENKVKAYNDAMGDVNSHTIEVELSDGNKPKLNESAIIDRIKEIENTLKGLENLKPSIASYINEKISEYRNQILESHNNNEFIQNVYKKEWKLKEEDYKKFYKGDKTDIDDIKIYVLDKYICGRDNKDCINSLYNKSLNIFKEMYKTIFKHVFTFDEPDNIEYNGEVNSELYYEKFKKGIESLGFNKDSFKVYALPDIDTAPDWVDAFDSHLGRFFKEDEYGDDNREKRIEKIKKYLNAIMTTKCEVNDDGFRSEKIDSYESDLDELKSALDSIRGELYGSDENGNVLDKDLADPDSKYGAFLAAKDKMENDDYAQAMYEQSIAQSGASEMNQMISSYETDKGNRNENNERSISSGVQSSAISTTQSIVAPQTVLDILGFISGMKKLTLEYPYIIQGISGLDAAYNKHYVIKDPYLGSGDDKITLTCLESLDLRVSSMFNRYFNAIYDRQYRRERVPVNLRRFNCSVYVHDVRNFVSKNNTGGSYNRLLELTDMYYSAVEFKFFDCEIVPEETGNIFNDISNEAPSDMKKTNFTFTYGNCVVNFVPPSEVSAHKYYI